MKLKRFIALLLVFSFGANAPGWGGIFTSRGKVALSAVAVLTGTTGSNITIQATPLPTSAFFGKNVVIPVQVTDSSVVSNSSAVTGYLSHAATPSFNVNMVYQLVDSNGVPLTSLVSVPVSFSGGIVDSNPNVQTFNGSAIIQSSDLQAIQHGGSIQYVFQATKNGAGTLWTKSGAQQVSGSLTSLPSPFQTTIITSICQPVTPAGAQVNVPDLFVHDGQTAIVLGPGAISASGTLCINQEDPQNWPSGPGGVKPVSIYTVTLNGASLVQTVQLVMSYPVDANGMVLNQNVDGNSLAIYWMGPEGVSPSNQIWNVLSRSQVDTTLHMVTAYTPHFSTFALFAAGAMTNADLRPPQRIITPNGDGVNDRAVFGSGIDQVKLFDIRGRRIKTIPGPAPQWDGTGDDGSIVASGVYIYQYSAQGQRVSGVIMVAK